MITPTTPCTDASLTPTKSGHPDTSSVHLVGVSVDFRSKVWKSISAVRRCSLRWRNTNFGSFHMMALYGDIRPFLLGIKMKAWRILAITEHNSANGIPEEPLSLAHTHPFITFRLAYRFGPPIQTVFLIPSNVNPKISLCTAHIASIFFRFFSDNGSYS